MGALNLYVSLGYYLTSIDVDDKSEEFVEACNQARPFTFITNMGVAIPAFEQQVIEKNEGDKFDFIIPCKAAYGEVNDELFITMPRDQFIRDGRFDSENIFVGNVIPLTNQEGQTFNAIVSEITETDVELDLNHPLAGKDLHFIGQVYEIRIARPEEISSLIKALAGSCGCEGGCGGNCGKGGCTGSCDEHGCGNCNK